MLGLGLGCLLFFPSLGGHGLGLEDFGFGLDLGLATLALAL